MEDDCACSSLNDTLIGRPLGKNDARVIICEAPLDEHMLKVFNLNFLRSLYGTDETSQTEIVGIGDDRGEPCARSKHGLRIVIGKFCS